MEKNIFVTVTNNHSSNTYSVGITESFQSLTHEEQSFFLLRELGYDITRLKSKTTSYALSA